MNVLIIKNISNEGPGTIEEYLRAGKVNYSVVDLNRGEQLPDPNTFTHLVVMGGPMAVYEMERYRHLRNEARLIEHAIRADMPVLGICLGAQMVAHVLGARVYAGGRQEIGWYQATITPEGMKDRLMHALAVQGSESAVVFQWHGDTFDIPENGVRLASSEFFPNQAFRYSDRVYALQFHIEVTPEIVLDWLKNEKSIGLDRVRSESNRLHDPYRRRAIEFYRGFFKL